MQKFLFSYARCVLLLHSLNWSLDLNVLEVLKVKSSLRKWRQRLTGSSPGRSTIGTTTFCWFSTDTSPVWCFKKHYIASFNVHGDNTMKCKIYHMKHIERFHMTSRRPHWCSKTKERQPKPILGKLNSILMQTASFVSVRLYGRWSREWKRSIRTWTILKKSGRLSESDCALDYGIEKAPHLTVCRPMFFLLANSMIEIVLKFVMKFVLVF